MKKQFLYPTLALAAMIQVSCKKNQLGGGSVITGKVAHHARAIPNATVYIKFDQKELPGTDIALYDASVVADAEGNYTIKCYKGDYFLYGTGTEIQNDSVVFLKGGVPVRVRLNETVKADVAISEAH